MSNKYVHGYSEREALRLHDQAMTLEELLHSDTHYQPGEKVLEAGCGIGAQTVILSKNSPVLISLPSTFQMTLLNLPCSGLKIMVFPM
jgi:cyclopropane fatty-acyl-phospholipid synthase-like methyltransferase